MIDNNRILEILRTVQNPLGGDNIIKSKLVHNLEVTENKVSFMVKAKGLNSMVKSEINGLCNQKIQEEYPQADVHIHFETEEAISKPLGQIKNIIAVASGKGGVGKSTISVNIAIALKNKGLRVGILDADVQGPSIPMMLGARDLKPKIVKLYGQNKIIPLEINGIHFMSMGNVVTKEQAVILRGPRLGGVLQQFLFEAQWPDLDYLVIDLPPGTGDIQLSLVQMLALTGVILVTTPQDVAIADAIKAGNMFVLENINVPILGVVENMSWFSPYEYPDNRYYIFGKGGGEILSKKYDTELLGQIPLKMGLREDADNGTLTGEKDYKEYFESIANKLVNQVNYRNLHLPATQLVRTQ